MSVNPFFSEQGLCRNRHPFPVALFSICFDVPSKGTLSLRSPYRTPTERDAPFPERSFIHLSKFAEYEPLPRSLVGPLWRELSVSRAFVHISFRVLKSNSPSQNSHRSRSSISTHSCIYLSISLLNEPTPTFLSGAPIEMEARHQRLSLQSLKFPQYRSPPQDSHTEKFSVSRALQLSLRFPSKCTHPHIANRTHVERNASLLNLLLHISPR
jgi:hypothetical protein